MVRNQRARHGWQQPDDLPDHGAVRRSGSNSGARQRRRPASHLRRPSRLGCGACLDRARPYVAQSRGGISAACAEASSVGGPSTCPSPDTSLMSSPVPPRGVVGVSPGSRCKGGIAPTGRGWPVWAESAEVPGVHRGVASCGAMLPRKDCPVAYWAAAGAEAANSRAAARAPAALIQWRRGKGAGTTPRVHSAVDQESLRAIELTRRLGPSRNGKVLGLTGP